MSWLNSNYFQLSVTVYLYVVLLVQSSFGLSSTKRHPYEFVKPLSSDSDGIQGPSPYSYGNPESSALINSNRRPALSLSDLASYQKTDKQHTATDSSSYHSSSNTLFENVPLPPIDDENKNDYDPKDLKDDAKMSMTFNENSEEKEDKIKRMPIVGDITKDNKRRIVIPLRYRNKRRRTDKNTEESNDEDNKDDESDIHSKIANNFSNSLFNQEDSFPSEQDHSIQISITDIPDETTTTTTTQNPTIVTSSTTIDDKVPAFVLNLKDNLQMMENEESKMRTTLHNVDENDAIRDPLALPLNAADLKNWGNNNFIAEDAKESEDVNTNRVDNDENSYPPQFSDTNVLFADGDIYSRLQKHKQVFTSRQNSLKQKSVYHKVQSREIPRTSPPALTLQDMQQSESSPRNVTKHPKAQPYRRYKTGGDEDYYYYDYDYDNGDYIEDDYYYRDYDGKFSNVQPNSVRRNSKPTQKPKYKLVRKKPSNQNPINSRYPSTSTISNHRYASTSTSNRRNPSLTSRRQQYPTSNVDNRFQNHRLPSHRHTQSSNGLNDYNSKAKMTSSDKYVPYGYTPHSRLPSNHLVKKSNKRQGVLSNNYQSHQANFQRPSRGQSQLSSAVPYNNPRRPGASSNRNKLLTPAGAGAAFGSGLRGPSSSSSTRRNKYYDYDNDEYYYDDEEFYDDYYDYDLPVKSRQKSRRRQGNGEVDRQYGVNSVDSQNQVSVEPAERQDLNLIGLDLLSGSNSDSHSGYASGGGGSNPLTLLVAPLAAISLLAAAAAVALNPVLVSVSLTGKKRRRRSLFGLEHDFDSDFSTENSRSGKVLFNGKDASSSITPEVQEKIDEMQVLEKFLGSVPSDVKYQQQILSMYLSCSGYTEPSNSCLDRVVCEYSDRNSAIEEEDRDVISIVLYNIMGNDFVGQEYKNRLRKAAKMGRDGKLDNKSTRKSTCAKEFPCLQLDNKKDNLVDDLFPKFGKKEAKERKHD